MHRLADPERELALSYAKKTARPLLRTLWSVDERFGSIVAGTTETTIGEMRLLWWREALAAASDHAAAEPLLQQVADSLGQSGADGAEWGKMAEGWFALLQEPLESVDLERFAEDRGGPLFRLSAALLTEDVPDWVSDYGRAWALVDLSFRIRDEVAASQARSLAGDILARMDPHKWPRTLRSLGALVILTRRDIGKSERRQGSPSRVLRMIYHNITGY
ncbi:hypothetical protein HFP51_04635 [Parasphingopyxis sp. CP4]|uniref:squalene/phytoene synthase family protein n=1 Tax=Parasphingopyxis sp. CP4 TaxID=2724527 RepID=UPI0015A219BA|nr:squalene/phytoene synthase family protein [Parasphingopyxis sp. CP4]QLC21525.1 hypothetical protein HFP51_04635 [Parasphingopyxis sp. CP4]